jgi:hypothetical protein
VGISHKATRNRKRGDAKGNERRGEAGEVRGKESKPRPSEGSEGKHRRRGSGVRIEVDGEGRTEKEVLRDL